MSSLLKELSFDLQYLNFSVKTICLVYWFYHNKPCEKVFSWVKIYFRNIK